MILHVQRTADDYREAHAAVKAQGLMTVSTTPFFYLFLGFALGSVLGNFVQRQPAGSAPRGPIEFIITSLPWALVLCYWAFIVFRSNGKKAHGFVTPPPKLTGFGVLVPALSATAAFAVTFLGNAFTPPGPPASPNQPELPLGTALAFLALPFVPIVSFLALSIVLFVRLHRLNVNRAFDLQVNLHRPVVIELSDNSLMVTSDVHQVRYAWNGFIGWHETANVFLLYISYISFEMVPKRAFTSPQQLEYFRQFVARAIGEQHRGFDPVPARAAPPLVAPMSPLPPPLPRQ